MRGLLRVAVWLVAIPLLALLLLWTCLCLRFSNLPGDGLRIGLSIGFAAVVVMAYVFLPGRRRTSLWFLAVCGGIQIWWACISPSHDREWEPYYSKLPTAVIEGNRVQVRNVRHFTYRSETDFDVHYEDREYDLDDLESVDFILSYWDGNEAICHTMFSFGFKGGQYLALSAETRREAGEPQDGLRGLMKQYEMIFILADERDLFRLRTNYRKEDVFVYPTQLPLSEVRALFLEFVGRVNSIHETPEWYNTITNNCTTALVPHLRRARHREGSLWSVLENGYTDRMAYDNQTIPNDLPFADTRERYHANQYVGTEDDYEDYSRRIRPGRPGEHAGLVNDE